MLRYHKAVYFNDDDILSLASLTDDLNGLPWNYSAHCLDNLKYRLLDIEKLLFFIRDLKLNSNDIFEFYKDNQRIIKVCYRIKYTDDIDIILVLSDDKNIITIYANSGTDKHETLKRELYSHE